MTTEFDPHAIIRKLATAEWVRKSLPDFASDPPGSVGTQSMEVPFASLRVRCNRCRGGGGTCWRCAGKGWVPEPDVEKACWRIMSRLFHDRAFDDAFWAWATEVDTCEEAVLRAAEAWLNLKRQLSPIVQ